MERRPASDSDLSDHSVDDLIHDEVVGLLAAEEGNTNSQKTAVSRRGQVIFFVCCLASLACIWFTVSSSRNAEDVESQPQHTSIVGADNSQEEQPSVVAPTTRNMVHAG